MPSLAPSAICASASERASAIFFSAERSLPDATDSSIDLAMRTVQVISDAKASPIITAFTMTSADMNITQGDSSFMAGAIRGRVGLRGTGVADAAAGSGGRGRGWRWPAEPCAVDWAGAAGGVCVWAETGDASQAAASIKAAARLAWKDMIFILRPSSE